MKPNGDGRKLAVVTGASRGIGRAIVELFLSHGYELLVVARRPIVGLEHCQQLSLDLTGADAAELFRRGLAAWLGGRTLDAGVLAAGTIQPIGLASAGGWQSQLALNLTAAMHTASSCAAHMRSGSTLVLLGSLAAYDMAVPGVAAYAAGKAGLRAFALALYSELQASGVRVSFVAPSLVRTELGRDAVAALGPEFGVAESAMIDCADVARSVLFCCRQPHGTNVLELVMETAAQPGELQRQFIAGSRKQQPSPVDPLLLLSPPSALYGFVTGASSGVGRATALALARRGYRLGLVARGAAQLEQVRQQCLREGSPSVEVFAFDVRQLDKLAAALHQLPDVHVSVASAGINRRRSIVESNGVLDREVIDINLVAAVEQLRLSAQIMVAHRQQPGPRHLLVVGSYAAMGLLGFDAGMTGYFASKSGMLGAAKIIWNDVRDFGIKISQIYPGLIDNPLGRKPGPFPYRYDGLITDDACAAALMHCLDAPPQSCITHMVIREQIPYHHYHDRIIERLAAKL